MTITLDGTVGATISGDMSFNSGYGSAAVAYGCRAWVNFNGTGTVAIRASGNVTSITDNGTGDYTVNITTALVDVNFSVAWSASQDTNGSNSFSGGPQTRTTSTVRLATQSSTSGAFLDVANANIAVFR